MTPRPGQYLHLEETPETPIFRRNEQLNSQKQNTVQRRLTKTRRGMGGGGHILFLQMQTRCKRWRSSLSCNNITLQKYLRLLKMNNLSLLWMVIVSQYAMLLIFIISMKDSYIFYKIVLIIFPLSLFQTYLYMLPMMMLYWPLQKLDLSKELF